MEPHTARTRVIVHGRVQGVFFRASTQRMVRDLGLNGWVRNLSDGTVEAVFEGEPTAVESAVVWVHEGPEHAYVERVERFAEEPEGVTGFSVR